MDVPIIIIIIFAIQSIPYHSLIFQTLEIIKETFPY